jgi:hypothetical protein
VTALALLAAVAAFSFVYLVLLVSGPDDGETTYPSYGAFLLAFAAIVVSSCVAIWGLGRAAPRTVLAGAGGVAVGATIFIVALEAVDTAGEPIEYYRGLFVLLLGLATAAALVGRRLRSAPRPT